MNDKSNYVPGVCNINPAEIQRRRQSGYVGAITAIIGAALFVMLHAFWPYYLALLVPLFVGALGFLQANSKFCAAYGSIGKQHADESDISSVDEDTARRADTLKARQLMLEAFLIAAPLTAAACVLFPLLYR